MFSVSLTATEEVSAAAIPSTAIVAPSPIPPVQVQPQVNPVAAIVRPIVSLALGLFGLAGDPSMPAEPPLGWALLAWVRRQFDQTLFNESPTFNFGTITTSQSDDQVITGTVAATDPDDDPLGYRVVDGPANGTVTIDPLTGAFTYTPDEGLAATGGTDTFTVAASELNTETHWHGPIRGILGAVFGIDRGDTAVATVTVTVLNTPPVANDDSETATEDTQTVLTVLDNDSDAEGNPITITGVSIPSSGGTAAANADGTITYTPGANFTGTDIFTYALNGGDTAGVTITVGAVDDAPTAIDDNTTVTEDTPTPIDVLTNDTDADGGPQQIQSVSDPANGSVVITAGGTGLTYTPDANYTGTDTFTYTLNGGDTATVTVTVDAVDDAPTFNPTFGEPDPVTGVVTGNLGGVDPDSTLVYPAGTVDTAHGKVQINADGSFTYTPTQAARLNAALTPGDDTDSFTVTYDGHDPAVTQTVSVTIDPAQATETATITVGSRPNGIAVSPVGTHAYATNFQDESVSVIDTTTNTVTATIPVGSLPAGVAVSPDGSLAYIANSSGGTVSVIDTATNTVTATIAVGATPYGIAVNPDPDRTQVYVVNSSGNSVSVIDTATNTVTATIAVGVSPFLIAVSPDGTHAYVTNRASHSVSVIDTATNTVTATVEVENALGIAFSPDGSLAYIASSTDDTVRILDTTTNTVIATVPVSGNAPVAVAVSPDGSRIYVANGIDSKVSVISIASITTTV